MITLIVLSTPGYLAAKQELSVIQVKDADIISKDLEALNAGIANLNTFPLGIITDTVSELTTNAGVTVEGVVMNSGVIVVDTINRATNAGIMVDGVGIQNGRMRAVAATVLDVAYQLIASGTGLYGISSTQVGFASQGNGLVGGFNGLGLFTGNIAEQVVGTGIVIPVILKRARTVAAVTTTITAAQIVAGIATIDTSGGGVNLQLPTAATLNNLGAFAVGDTFDFKLVQHAHATNAVTITTNTGLTLLTFGAVEFTGVRIFTLLKTGAAAYSVY